MTGAERLSLLAVVEGEPLLQPATVVHRDQHMLHVNTDGPLTLSIGNVVAVMVDASAGREAAASLALVTESADPGTTALRMLGRRR